MTLDYTICPHCGFRSEDDEFCAACGKLFRDDPVPTRDVSVLGALGSDLRSQVKKIKFQLGDQDEIMPEEDPWSDTGWSTLRGNLFYRK